MFQTLLSLLPQTSTALALWLGPAGLVVGLAIWLAGARYSRMMIALLAVLAGGIIGSKLPAWYGWSVDKMGTAVAGAMLLGFLGFALQRLWVGVGLSAVLAFWTALAGTAIKHIHLDWTWPAIDPTTTVPGYLQTAWNVLPVGFAHIVIIAACVSLVTGLILAAATPRLSVLLLWSWIGATLGMVSIALLLQTFHPAMLPRILPRQWVQGAIVAGLVLLGMVLQARLSPAARQSVGKKKPPKPKKDAAKAQAEE